jgi:hypothetical protein
LIETFLYSKTVWALHVTLFVNDMQTVEFGIFMSRDDDGLLERIPAFLIAAQWDENICKEVLGIARSGPRFAPVARLRLDVSFQNEIRRGDIRLDLPPQLFFQRTAVFRDPDV